MIGFVIGKFVGLVALKTLLPLAGAGADSLSLFLCVPFGARPAPTLLVEFSVDAAASVTDAANALTGAGVPFPREKNRVGSGASCSADVGDVATSGKSC